MKLPISIVDAFTHERFGGNPAAVVVLEAWRPAVQTQAIAKENNLSETAFLLREADGAFAIRWLSPTREIAFCGHATLASAHVIAQRALTPFDVAVTAPGTLHDCVSRYFWLANGGAEDPVTGSIYTALAPYWATRWGRTELVALQASARSGLLH